VSRKQFDGFEGLWVCDPGLPCDFRYREMAVRKTTGRTLWDSSSGAWQPDGDADWRFAQAPRKRGRAAPGPATNGDEIVEKCPFHAQGVVTLFVETTCMAEAPLQGSRRKKRRRKRRRRTSRFRAILFDDRWHRNIRWITLEMELRLHASTVFADDE